jgi:thymidylate synthase ThyX
MKFIAEIAPLNFSPLPEVRLHKAFTTPFHNALATARTCYSSKGIIDDTEITAAHYPLAASIYEAGHHTVLGHAHFQFAISNVSRHFIWSFLHSHPHYNSEQVSQRYVAVKPEAVLVPPLIGQARAIYETTVARQMQAYQQLTTNLMGLVTREYRKLFPHHSVDSAAIRSKLHKRALEIARYVLPVATLSYLYHTVSGITLLRYYRLARQYDLPSEQQLVVEQMVAALLAYDPAYEQILAEPLPLEATPEYAFFSAAEAFTTSVTNQRATQFRAEFDESLDGYTSRLVDYKQRNESSLAAAVREVLGQPRSALSDDEAIELVLNPAKNRLLGETLNLTLLSKLGRTLHHPAYTFQRRLSHTADSQDQRHRLTPASRPVLLGHLTDTPDYLTPVLIQQDAALQQQYDQIMLETWDAIQQLRGLGVREEWVSYLLPNAVAIRYTESADLLGLHHKHRMRLCYLAQEEIWQASLEEAQQVCAVNPRIGRYLLPPCTQRYLARTRPTCPEGERFCGVKVWQLELKDYQRLI